MNKVYYESIISNDYNLLIGYTQDAIVRATFNVNEKFETEFLKFLEFNFEVVQKNNDKSNFGITIEKYLNKDTDDLKMPVKLIGTEFNKKVWMKLMDIPYGHVKTYKDIAKEVGCDKGYRAVGNANNKNPIVLIVPCHRVIGSKGDLTGFAPGVDVKTKLLKLEGIDIIKKNDKYYVVTM